jgi:hypothetical protein
MKNTKYIIGLFLAFSLVFTSCEKAVDKDFGPIVAPSNLQITAEIVGQDADHPYGDGSGVVNFTTTAKDAITYKYIYQGAQTMAPAGTTTYSFGKTGTHKYTVTAVAIGTAGVTSSATIEVEVLALYAPPADLLTMLTSNSSRTWRVEAESPGHFGVGPADSPDPIWWAANPYDKDGLGAYDDRLVFHLDGSFDYLTNGDIYGKAAAISPDFNGDQGLTANGNGEFVNYPADDFTDNWSLSAPGGVETLTFASKGFHGFYVGGDHSYVILSRSANEMHLRTTGADGLGWFVILIAED